MCNAILIDPKGASRNTLSSMLGKHCPQINICAETDCISAADALISNVHPELIFIELGGRGEAVFDWLKEYAVGLFEVIFTTDSPNHAIEAIYNHAIGYLLNPINKDKLIASVNYALSRIREKEELHNYKTLIEKLRNASNEEIIGIPTIEGFEFVSIKSIIRCEGLRRYTRVITREKKDIISSYNLGEFIKKLEAHHFFSPHKSHLINLAYLRKFLREGTIILSDGTPIPVSKRRKCAFLRCIEHL